MTDPDDSDRLDERRRRLLQAAGALTSLGLAGCGATEATTSTATSATPTTDTTTTTTGEPSPIQRRVADLSLREKVGQMTLVALNGQVDTSTIRGLLADPGVGGILYGAANPASFDAQTVAEQMNEYQTRAREQTDHGIPLLTGIDAVHGNATVSDAVVFPHNVGMGATWRPDLVRKRAEVTSRSLRAMGVNWNYAPVADLLYDPRWGRFYEGFHEFPSAVKKYVTASVEGLEAGDGDTTAVSSSTKHFAGYSMATAGNDRDDARIPERDLREKVFPPFEAGVEAGTGTVMANSGTVNGIPTYTSSWLQQTVLVDEMGFDGIRVTDWGDLWKMVTKHNFTDFDHYQQAATEMLAAGMDMYMSNYYPGDFIDLVVTLVQNGDLPEERIDEAVTRILRVKERLGLFDDPFVAVEGVSQDVVTDRDHDLARQAAEQSMTVLEQGLLPLEAPDTVLVTGPNADDPRAQHGGWTLGWQGLATETTPPTTTILEGIRQQAPTGTTVEHVPTGRQELSNAGAVRAAAADADVVVAVLGEDSYAEGRGDINDLRLPAGQRRLLTILAEQSASTVGVLVAGRPRGGDHLFETTDGLLMAYQPGSKGGQAVGKALFGRINPGGRLPFTWPAATGSVPVAATKRGPMPDAERRYPIGHGDHYTTMLAKGLLLDPMSIDPTQTERVTLSYTVENYGNRRGDHLAAATIDRQGSDPTTTPWTRLTDWQRLSLDPGEKRDVSIEFPVERLAVRDGDVTSGEWVIPAGTLTLSVGPKQVAGTVTETVALSALNG